MSDPRSKISAGLAKGQAVSGRPVSPLTVAPRLHDLVGVRGDIPSLKKLKSTVLSNHANVVQIRDAVTNAFAEQEPKIREQNKRYGMSPGDKDGHWYDDLGEVKRNEHITRSLNRMRKDVVAINAETVNKHMIAIRQAQATLASMRELWADSVSVLMRRTLYSERRAMLIQNLAHAGQKELIDAMETAVRHNDRDLGAACAVRLDAMPKTAREQVQERFTKHDLAEALMQSDLKTARAYIMLAEAHAAEAEIAAREALGMKVNPTDRIGLGNRKAEIERELGVSLEDLLKEDDASTVTATDDATPPVIAKDADDPVKKIMDPWIEFMAAYDAGNFEEARRLAAKHNFDIFEDDDSDTREAS